MTETDELRRMLDERGVEYDTDDEDGCEFTEWMANGLEWEADSRGELVYLTPVMLITPEQAVEATLGDADATGERQRDAVEVVRCKDCERFAVDQSDHDYRTGWWCKRWYTDMVKPDGFCAWAKKMED